MLKWTPEFLERVPVNQVLTQRNAYDLEHFPRLISDQCLQGDHSLLAKHIKASLLRGHMTRYEVIPMPRGLSGDRPVLLPDLVTRLAYASLVALADPILDPPSRSDQVREDFRDFGSQERKKAYVVISDIAACYEYIVPEILAEELFLRSDDYELVSHLSSLLTDLSLLGRGIPQMLDPSDRLSDLYLAKVDRALDRAGLNWRLTADDYKVVVPTWEETTEALELLEREVRGIGLILSADKTRLVTAGQRAVTQGSGTVDTDFDFEDEESEDPSDVLLEWHEAWSESRGTARIVEPPPASIIWALTSVTGLTPGLLADVAFAHPPHLEHVIEFVLRLASDSDEYDDFISETFQKLLETANRSGWSRLWLVEGASRLLEMEGFGHRLDVREIAVSALDDSREAVRVQAAWLLAKHYRLTVDQLRKVHLKSSILTISGVSACTSMAAVRARTGRNELKQMLAGVVAKEPLNELAAKWAESQT